MGEEDFYRGKGALGRVLKTKSIELKGVELEV